MVGIILISEASTERTRKRALEKGGKYVQS